MGSLQIGSVLLGLIAASLGFFGYNGKTDREAQRAFLLPVPETPEGQTDINAMLPEYVDKGLEWLATAQGPNGGWGAGQYTAQQIRDPHTVEVDPATTALAGMALIRTGNTLSEGEYSENLRKALEYLLEAVEDSPDEGSQITDQTGTQPQRKLGRHIDVSMAAQFFGKILPHAEGDTELKERIEKAIDKCVKKLEGTQQADGSWNTGGWAPVLQSAMANNALEQAKLIGREVKDETLNRSKDYQRGNIDATSGAIKADKGAGITLYAAASNQRANAGDVREARVMVRKISDSLRSVDPDMEVAADSVLATVENFVQMGYHQETAEELVHAYKQDLIVRNNLKNDRVLAGFGNNGGEEFLSFMMTSESLAMEGGEAWDDWYNRMDDLFGKIQNGDGSWSGHHCITSPVFCTAAVIMTMTADRDPDLTKFDLD